MIGTMTHKEMTAHIRSRLKAEKIKARVRMDAATFGLPPSIYVDTPAFDARFTAEEARRIAEIAVANRLTLTRGAPVDVEIAEQTGSVGFCFENPNA